MLTFMDHLRVACEKRGVICEITVTEPGKAPVTTTSVWDNTCQAAIDAYERAEGHAKVQVLSIGRAVTA